MLKQLVNKLFNREPTPLPPPPVAPLMPRAVDISGNIFHFRMPEDFSRDVPAKPLKDNIDLNSNSDLITQNAVELLTRWWDFNDPHYFRYGIGSLVLNSAIVQRAENEHEDFSDYDQLIRFIHHKLQEQYETKHQHLLEEGREDVMTFIPDYPEEYGFVDINGQTWMKHILSGPVNKDQYYLPITERHYLRVGFHFTKTTFNIHPEDYWPQFEAAEARILSTLYVEFAKGNSVGDKINSKNNLDRLESHPGKLPPDMPKNTLLSDDN